MLFLISPDNLEITSIAKSQLDKLNLAYTYSSYSPFNACNRFPTLQWVKNGKLKKELCGKHSDEDIKNFLEDVRPFLRKKPNTQGTTSP